MAGSTLPSFLICIFRRVVGWAMGTTLERGLVLSPLNGAHVAPTGDRTAVPYADYQAALQKVGAVCRMSRRGNCCDNAPVESFCVSIKCELVCCTSLVMREEARAALFEWIAVWYNRKWRHSFEQQNQQPEPMRKAD